MNENPFQVIDSRLSSIEDLLSQLTNRPAGDYELKKDIGGLEVAIEETGLSKHSIYRICHYKTLPHFKKGGRLYFSRKELQTWIKTDSRRGHREEGV